MVTDTAMGIKSRFFILETSIDLVLKKIVTIFFFVWGAGFLHQVQAQVGLGPDNHRYGVASFYGHTEPGDIPMYVHIWGYVYRPGLYELPIGTKLSTALSLSGGFSLGARQWSEERTVTLELFATSANGSLEPVLQDSWVNSQVRLMQDPVLTNGNVLVIDAQTKRRFNWRDALTIVGAAASVAIAVERLSSI